MVWKEFTCSPSTKTWSGGSRRLTVAAYTPLNQGLPAFPGAQLIWKSRAPLRVQLNRACKGVFFWVVRMKKAPLCALCTTLRWNWSIPDSNYRLDNLHFYEFIIKNIQHYSFRRRCERWRIYRCEVPIGRSYVGTRWQQTVAGSNSGGWASQRTQPLNKSSLHKCVQRWSRCLRGCFFFISLLTSEPYCISDFFPLSGQWVCGWVNGRGCFTYIWMWKLLF
jgi:hypothetical protein